MSKTMNLSSDLIVRKGNATPAAGQDEHKPETLPTRKSGTIAVTLRLDPERYEQLKIYGAYNRITNQDIIVSALDAYFDKNKSQRT